MLDKYGYIVDLKKKDENGDDKDELDEDDQEDEEIESTICEIFTLTQRKSLLSLVFLIHFHP